MKQIKEALYLLRKSIDDVCENHLTFVRLTVEEAESVISALALLTEPEPVAWMWQHNETGRIGFVENFTDDEERNLWQMLNKRLSLVSPLYAHASLPSRDAVIEECAKVCEKRLHREFNKTIHAVTSCVAAIRALKENK